MGGGGEILCSNPIFPAPPLAKGLWGDTVSPVQRWKPEPDLEPQGHCSVQVDSTCWFSDGHKQDSHVTKDFICGRRERKLPTRVQQHPFSSVVVLYRQCTGIAEKSSILHTSQLVRLQSNGRDANREQSRAIREKWESLSEFLYEVYQFVNGRELPLIKRGHWNLEQRNETAACKL